MLTRQMVVGHATTVAPALLNYSSCRPQFQGPRANGSMVTVGFKLAQEAPPGDRQRSPPARAVERGKTMKHQCSDHWIFEALHRPVDVIGQCSVQQLRCSRYLRLLTTDRRGSILQQRGPSADGSDIPGKFSHGNSSLPSKEGTGVL